MTGWGFNCISREMGIHASQWHSCATSVQLLLLHFLFPFFLCANQTGNLEEVTTASLMGSLEFKPEHAAPNLTLPMQREHFQHLWEAMMPLGTNNLQATLGMELSSMSAPWRIQWILIRGESLCCWGSDEQWHRIQGKLTCKCFH